MSKIYWSRNSDPEDWCTSMKSYYFPFAWWFVKYTWGQWIICKYLDLRTWIKP